MIGSVCLALVVALIFGLAYSTFAYLVSETTQPPLYDPATITSSGHGVAQFVIENPAITTIPKLTLVLVEISLALPALLLYGMGSAALYQGLVVWGRVLLGAYGESPGLDKYMKMWAFSVKSLGRPRVTPGHRRVEWKCVSVAERPNLALQSLTVVGMRQFSIWRL